MQPPEVNAAGTTADFEFAALNEAKNYRAALAREFAPFLRGQVLEIGAGVGQMTREFRAIPGVGEVVAVEPDPRFHAGFAANNPGTRLVKGIVADVPERTGWEALVSVNVLEHIEADAAELKAWHGLLRERHGRACIFVPARPEIYAPIDADFGHFRRYTKPGLNRILVEAGFTVERLCYFNWVGYFAWWLNFRVRQQRGFDIGAVRFFDRVVFPPVHWSERTLFRPPFGQSLLAVARA
ncbi:MAG: class I SAM-dependent methyltransferase [Verrucomicrobia bacterium]|nr:MAG: class I SAM-dependent methyltransferase [Verrucomicrobiota bacterium]